MDMIAWTRSALAGTAVEQKLSSLVELYAEAEREMNEWKNASEISCSEGCGICCENFNPDLLNTEAELIACYLLSERPDLLDRLRIESTHCIFYRRSASGGCSIYPARPLVCRLFGFSSVKNRVGERIIKLCKNMQDRGVRSYTDVQALEIFGTAPPAMQDFSYRLHDLDGGAADQRRMIKTAVEESLAKIRFLIHMIDPEKTPPLQPAPVKRTA